MRLGRVDDVLVHGRRCLEIRRAAADLVAMAQCASTVCHLLGELGRPELAKDFAFELIAIWKRTRAERPLLSGTRRLLDALKPHHDAEIAGLLAALVDDLRGLHADRWSGEARELSEAITNSEWYIGALPPERRAALEREQELAEACRRGAVARVRAMLDAGADPDARDAFDRTPLIHAAFAGHLEVARLLLDRGAGANAENLQRRSALVLAADQGHTEIVELLLDRGADPDHAGIHDQTALHVAGWQGHVAVVRALLAGGADPELHDATGNTPLTLAATEDVPDVVRVMISGGAVVDGSTPAGHTALMKAAMEGRARVVEALLALGADPRLRDRHGMTAADWARQEGFLDLGSVLARAVTAAPSSA
jgi:ankyrin repeat protein